MNGIPVLTKGTPRAPSLLSPCEDTAKGCPSTNQGADSPPGHQLLMTTKSHFMELLIRYWVLTETQWAMTINRVSAMKRPLGGAPNPDSEKSKNSKKNWSSQKEEYKRS